MVRRLLRILLDAATALFLLLCMATVVLWVRSYWRADLVGWVRPARPGTESIFFDLGSGGGGVAIYVGFYSRLAENTWIPVGWHKRGNDRRPIRYAGADFETRWGFGYGSFRDYLVRFRCVIFPIWLPTTLFALLSLTRVAFVIRRYRGSRQGRCRSCGYDLRATPDRCPECGTVPTEGRAPAPEGGRR